MIDITLLTGWQSTGLLTKGSPNSESSVVGSLSARVPGSATDEAFGSSSLAPLKERREIHTLVTDDIISEKSSEKIECCETALSDTDGKRFARLGPSSDTR